MKMLLTTLALAAVLLCAGCGTRAAPAAQILHQDNTALAQDTAAGDRAKVRGDTALIHADERTAAFTAELARRGAERTAIEHWAFLALILGAVLAALPYVVPQIGGLVPALRSDLARVGELFGVAGAAALTLAPLVDHPWFVPALALLAGLGWAIYRYHAQLAKAIHAVVDDVEADARKAAAWTEQEAGAVKVKILTLVNAIRAKL